MIQYWNSSSKERPAHDLLKQEWLLCEAGALRLDAPVSCDDDQAPPTFPTSSRHSLLSHRTQYSIILTIFPKFLMTSSRATDLPQMSDTADGSEPQTAGSASGRGTSKVLWARLEVWLRLTRSDSDHTHTPITEETKSRTAPVCRGRMTERRSASSALPPRLRHLWSSVMYCSGDRDLVKEQNERLARVGIDGKDWAQCGDEESSA
jgi:hypothetical protein